jgi:spore coat protein U-like protein
MKTPVVTILAVSLLASPAAASVAACTAGATAVAFGVYDPTSGVPLPSTGTVTVSCVLILGPPLTMAYTIALSAGGGSFAARKMHFGTPALSYNLYTTAGYAAVWGDGTGGSSLQSDSYLLGASGAIKNYSIFGRIPASQAIPAGVYTDAIVVTITY